MGLPTQQILPGRFATAYRETLERMQAASAMQKIWSKDASLWEADAQHTKVIGNRLGWIGVLDAMRSEAANLSQFAKSVGESGMRDIVLLGMGGSSLAPEVFALTFPSPDKDRRFFVLDSTDPDSVRNVEKSIDLRRTLFVVASKSGKTLETLSQFSYFHERLQASGVRPAGKNFIAITDPGSHLDQLASDQVFQRTFRNAPDIGGRYSALSYFGLVPAALWGVSVEDVVRNAIEMRDACGPSSGADVNPAIKLGSLLGTAARQASDKLILMTTPSLVPLGNWIEQLIAESTGKQGKGIVPVAGGVPLTPEVFANGCVVAMMSQQGEETSELDAVATSLAERGVPVVRICLAGPDQLGAEFFKWEAATAVAGAVLAIDPFDEPNVQESKDRTAAILESFEAQGKMPISSARLRESGIELHAEGATQRKLSIQRLTESLRTFFELRKPGDYVSLLAYVDRNASNAAPLAAMREGLAQALGLPILLGYGPRYLHSIGQLHKGGPPNGMFLVITAAHTEDVAIPGAKYTFSQLEFAQALGDFESLSSREKPVLRLHLSEGAAIGLPKLRNALKQAVSSIRVASR